MKVKDQKIISYLTFSLGSEHFALNVGQVVNILEMQAITKVPKCSEYFTGITNLRGEVLPIIDTNIKLGLGKTETTNGTCILVIESIVSDSQIKFGILVDFVREVLEIEDEKILPPPSLTDNSNAELITGVVEQAEKFIMVLDINKLLENKEIIEVQNLANKKKITNP